MLLNVYAKWIDGADKQRQKIEAIFLSDNHINPLEEIKQAERLDFIGRNGRI